MSDYTAFYMVDDSRTGSLAEFGPTEQIFRGQNKATEDYITGRFG